MIYRNDMAVAKKTGGRGRETFYRNFTTPVPRIALPLAVKNFVFIGYRVGVVGVGGEVVFVNEESAVLKILGAF